jgi:hypothetical protein
MKEYTFLRIWRKTHERINEIRQHTGEGVVELIDRLAKQEQKRMARRKEKGSKE